MDINIDLSKSRINEHEISKYKSGIDTAMERLWSDKEEFTGWVKLPINIKEAAVEAILNAAALIQGQCQELIVIGIGGSYLGARAVIHALVGEDEIYGTGIPSRGYPKVRFAGNNLSATYLSSLLTSIELKEVCLCVISKSGTTIEPAAAFSVLKDALVKKYGREIAAKRIYAITDAQKGDLREEALREGYTTFEIPENIGGRFSVLTPVGLLPIAVSGINIRELLVGAEAMATATDWDFNASDYAAVRNEFHAKGKTIEIFEYYEPQLEYFAEWLKQLFGESEGKCGKGLYPTSLQFSADLHSMGQYLQEGNQIFFETVLNVEKPCRNIQLPEEFRQRFGQNDMNRINAAAMEGVIAAHEAVNIPIVKIDIPQIDAFYLGQLIYYFETSCALSAYLLGVSPFDQPGVEFYKKEMSKKIDGIKK